MTVPTGGGRTITVKVGQAAQLLTEYAPPPDADSGLTLINIGNDRVWLADDSSVSSGRGVPLDPGTSIPWQAPGQVWVAPDAAAAATTTIVLTGAIQMWTPSPAAIAAQVAAELLATGIPSVLVTDTIFNGTLAASGDATFDVSKYASLLIQNDSASLFYRFSNDKAGTQLLDGDYLPSTEVGAGMSARLAVLGPWLYLQNFDISACDVLIIGSNRAALNRLDYRSSLSAQGDKYASASGAIHTGDILNMNGGGVPLHGTYESVYLIPSGVSGRFELTPAATGLTTIVCDSKEMISSSSGTQLARLDTSIPPGQFGLAFRALGTNTGSGSCAVQFYPKDL